MGEHLCGPGHCIPSPSGLCLCLDNSLIIVPVWFFCFFQHILYLASYAANSIDYIGTFAVKVPFGGVCDACDSAGCCNPAPV